MIPSLAVDELASGATVDRYRLLVRLGEGGQGDVWRAEDTLRPGVQVALKLISLPAATSTSADRLRREARLLARLEHPSLPRCHAIFEDPRKDIFGFALDLVDGASLVELQGTPALDTAQRLHVLLHIARALRFVHQSGLVHRDIKASNIVIDDAFFARPHDPSTVKLLDFGIATEQENPRRLTAPGSVIGTTSHLAPELLDRGFWRERSDGAERDLFAFGVLAFQLFRGTHPTGLPPDAGYGDYLVVYREHATKGVAWLGGVKGDLLEMLYRRCLALRAGERATSEEAIVLLEQAQLTARDGSIPTPVLPVSTSSPTRVAMLGSDLPAAVAPMAIHTTSRSWVLTPGPPRSEPASFTDPPRPSSVPGFTSPVPFSTPWPPSVTPPIPVTPDHASSSSKKESDGWARPALLVAALLVGAFALAFGYVRGLNGESEEPAATAPLPLFTVTSPVAPTVLSLAPLPQAPPGGTPRSWLPPDDPPPVAMVKCPRGMDLILDGQRTCIDHSEVTVDAYVRSGAQLSNAASWPGADAGGVAEQSANCASQRRSIAVGKEPVNCVSWEEAKAYCEKRGKRLPAFDELSAASAVIARCKSPSTICPLYEWTADEAGNRRYRRTLGPSFRSAPVKGSNDKDARNDDLGFRCISDVR